MTAYVKKPGQIVEEEVVSIQMDAKGKDSVGFWSANERLQGPVGFINDVVGKEKLKGVPIEVPTKKGAVEDLPPGTIIRKMVMGKETTSSTPEKVSYYQDIYEIVINGKSYPVDGGLEVAQKRLAAQTGAQAQVQPAAAAPANHLVIPIQRLYEMSWQLYELEFGGNQYDEDELAQYLITAVGMDGLHYWLSRSKAPKIRSVFFTGYPMARFVDKFLSQVMAVEDKERQRKLLVFCLVSYINHRTTGDQNHEDALAKMQEEAKPYIEKVTRK